MSKRQVIMLLGVWVLVLPFLGFPGGWLRTIGFITGLVIIGIAYRMKPASIPSPFTDKPYIEHKTPPTGAQDPAVHNPLANQDISGSI